MSYRANGSQQLSIFDRSLRLTRRERSFLEKSWAKVFSDEIFPAIDEERFRVLYSQNASRPNTPVNIIVGALIIKELFALSDDEIVENLMLDIHYQYALHTTSYEEQPLSDKSLSRFRKRCYEYEKTTGVDLFHECVCDLNRKIAKLMGINSHVKRMDSLMIEANIRKLSRIELLYSCVARLAKRIEKKEGIGKLTGLEHYCQPGDRNFIVYHCRNTDMNERIETILKDADQLLLRSAAQYQETEEYRLLVRCLDEQTIAGSGGRRLRKKGEESPSTTSLQNPTDPDATYCVKAGKDHIGYGYNYDKFMTGTDLDKAKTITGGVNFILGKSVAEQDLPDKEKTQNIYIKEALLLKQALSLCGSLVDEKTRLEAAFFESLRTMIVRLLSGGTGKKFTLPEVNERINELLKHSIKSEGVH